MAPRGVHSRRRPALDDVTAGVDLEALERHSMALRLAAYFLRQVRRFSARTCAYPFIRPSSFHFNGARAVGPRKWSISRHVQIKKEGSGPSLSRCSCLIGNGRGAAKEEGKEGVDACKEVKLTSSARRAQLPG